MGSIDAILRRNPIHHLLPDVAQPIMEECLHIRPNYQVILHATDICNHNPLTQEEQLTTKKCESLRWETQDGSL